MGIWLVAISRFGDGLYNEFGQEISRVWAHEFGKGLAYHELGCLARAGGDWVSISRFGIVSSGGFGAVRSGRFGGVDFRDRQETLNP